MSTIKQVAVNKGVEARRKRKEAFSRRSEIGLKAAAIKKIIFSFHPTHSPLHFFFSFCRRFSRCPRGYATVRNSPPPVPALRSPFTKEPKRHKNMIHLIYFHCLHHNFDI